jgi:hypothetical protein
MATNIHFFKQNKIFEKTEDPSVFLDKNAINAVFSAENSVNRVA